MGALERTFLEKTVTSPEGKLEYGPFGDVCESLWGLTSKGTGDLWDDALKHAARTSGASPDTLIGESSIRMASFVAACQAKGHGLPPHPFTRPEKLVKVAATPALAQKGWGAVLGGGTRRNLIANNEATKVDEVQLKSTLKSKAVLEVLQAAVAGSFLFRHLDEKMLQTAFGYFEPLAIGEVRWPA